MLRVPPGKVIAIGEAMLELVPVGDGLYRRGYAGDTFNTIWHIAQLLGPDVRAGFVTRVGSDSLSEVFVTDCIASGLDVTGILRDPARTMGLYMIDLDGVERSFHYWRSASAARHLADDPAALAASVQGAGLIHVSGITLAILSPTGRRTLIGVLAEARAAGALVSFDPNIRPRLWASTEDIHQTVVAMLVQTDIVLPSFDDETAVWGDVAPDATLARFAAAGVREVTIKNGEGPVTWMCDGMTGSVPTPAVDRILDTTGAGDAFNAGYLSARRAGLEPDRAVAAGQATSAAVLRTHGAKADLAELAAATLLVR